MAKDKKSKSDGKKAKLAEKKQKQEKKGEKKEKAKLSKADEYVMLPGEAFLILRSKICLERAQRETFPTLVDNLSQGVPS
jgi:hypothetical protein